MIHMFNSPSCSYYHFLFVLHGSIRRPQLRSVPHVCSRCLAPCVGGPARREMSILHPQGDHSMGWGNGPAG